MPKGGEVDKLERQFGVRIQFIPKPLFNSVLARTVRRTTVIPKLSATAASEEEAATQIRAQLKEDIEVLKCEFWVALEDELSSGSDETMVLRECVSRLLDEVPSEALRDIIKDSGLRLKAETGVITGRKGHHAEVFRRARTASKNGAIRNT
jgi:hypothetical protein